ncbi:MAG: type II toxin-antitoxin system RelE/ParE family toxin [Armatimonadetes bacterium]|nr:type II toxin-antitoxin system RelE/ParE family toxin [Armatimonadota bacterium]
MASLHPRVYAAVDKRIRGLSDDPRPPGAALLKGGWKGYWRVRSGDYRVIYEIDDRQRIVTVAYVGPRESIY